MVVRLSKRSKQLENELKVLKDEVSQLAGKKEAAMAVQEGSPSIGQMIKYMAEEREKTNKLLVDITAKIGKLEKEIEEFYSEPASDYTDIIGSRELPLSALERKILDFVQSSPEGMICADDLMRYMNYRGRNAACSRLNKLYRQGVLDRYQLGHKVFYKFDAGKATNTLIISPPQ